MEIKYRWRVSWEADGELHVEWMDDFDTSVKRLISLKNDFERKLESSLTSAPAISTLSHVQFHPDSDIATGVAHASVKKKHASGKKGWQYLFSGDVMRCRYLGKDDG